MLPVRNADESNCEKPDFPAQYSCLELVDDFSILANGSRGRTVDLSFDL